jgi:hypothetical protein
MDEIYRLRERILSVRIELELVRCLIDNSTNQSYIDRCDEIQCELEEINSELLIMELAVNRSGG